MFWYRDNDSWQNCCIGFPFVIKKYQDKTEWIRLVEVHQSLNDSWSLEQNNGSDNKDDEGNNKTDYNDMNNRDDINNIWPSFSIIIIIREIKEKKIDDKNFNY